MDWNQAIRDERAMLARVIALLLSLANLAERAARHSRAAACLMLFILRPVEAAVSNLSDDLPELPFAVTLDPRKKLAHLALRLRTLACLMKFETEFALASDPEPRRPLGVTRHQTGAIVTLAMTAFDFRRCIYAPDTS